jgi:hypothetical protein
MANTMSLFMMLFVSSNPDRLIPRSTQRASATRISDNTAVIPNGTAAINWTKRLNDHFASKYFLKLARTVTSLKRWNSFLVNLLNHISTSFNYKIFVTYKYETVSSR